MEIFLDIVCCSLVTLLLLKLVNEDMGSEASKGEGRGLIFRVSSLGGFIISASNIVYCGDIATL